MTILSPKTTGIIFDPRFADIIYDRKQWRFYNQDTEICNHANLHDSMCE